MDGFSRDGYIVDQDFFSAYIYRRMTSDINGCGWIAAYNLRHALGQDVSFEDVNREMDAMIRVQIPGPTPMRVMRAYLCRYAGVRSAFGKRASLAAAERSFAGVLRYREGPVSHFICFVRTEGPRFRFMNVADGQEDITETMSDFFRGHCRRGHVRALTVSGGPA